MWKIYLKRRIKNFIGRIGLKMFLFGAGITEEEYWKYIAYEKKSH
jgi:hypothetical protein